MREENREYYLVFYSIRKPYEYFGNKFTRQKFQSAQTKTYWIYRFGTKILLFPLGGRRVLTPTDNATSYNVIT